jgi:pyruvate formate lyase activating enzyme
VVVTGGEPTLQPDLPDFIGALRAMGFAVKLDTNGSRPGVVAALLAASLVDFLAMDVKAPPEKYPALCGGAVDLDAVRATVDLLSAGTVPHHFRTTLYPPLLSAGDLPAVRALLPPGAEHRVQAFRDPGAGGCPPGHPVEKPDEPKKSSILL